MNSEKIKAFTVCDRDQYSNVRRCVQCCQLRLKTRQTNYRVRISSWISSWIFELDFRVWISSWIFELDFRVGFSSGIFELDFRVRISS